MGKIHALQLQKSPSDTLPIQPDETDFLLSFPSWISASRQEGPPMLLLTPSPSSSSPSHRFLDPPFSSKTPFYIFKPFARFSPAAHRSWFRLSMALKVSEQLKSRFLPIYICVCVCVSAEMVDVSTLTCVEIRGGLDHWNSTLLVFKRLKECTRTKVWSQDFAASFAVTDRTSSARGKREALGWKPPGMV